MLLRLTQSQVSENWDIILAAIKKSFPPTQVFDDNTSERLLKSVFDNKLVVWVYIRDKEVVTIVTTTISEDFCTGQKSLLIFSATSVKELTQSEWANGIAFLRVHARSIGCSNIIAYTKIDSLAKVLAVKVGADTDNILIKMEV